MSNELRKKLYISLFNTEMTKYDISKIGIERSSSDDYLLKIDVHCYTVEQVNRILNKILAIKSYPIDSIEVIHGYHNGSAIKDFLQDSFRHKKIKSLKLDLVNEGVTHIYLRKSNIKNVKKIKSGNRIGCNSTSKNKNLTDPFEEKLFMLNMIQEKIRTGVQKEVTFGKYLFKLFDENEIEYIEDIADLKLSIEVFLYRIEGYYFDSDSRYIKVKVKSIDQLKVSGILESLVENWSQKKFVLSILAKRTQRVKIIDYIKKVWPQFEVEEKNDLINLKL